MKARAIQKTKHTMLKSVRLPHWLINLAKENGNASEEIVELMELGAIAKHGKDFVDITKSK